MPGLTFALLAALPNPSTSTNVEHEREHELERAHEPHDARVWRWVCAQQGLAHDEQDVHVPDVEDESARIRSSFSDASSESGSELEFDRESAYEEVLDAVPVTMTMDSLVYEIDTFLAGERSLDVARRYQYQDGYPQQQQQQQIDLHQASRALHDLAPEAQAQARKRAATMPSRFILSSVATTPPAPVLVPAHPRPRHHSRRHVDRHGHRHRRSRRHARRPAHPVLRRV